ncbi:transglycosylase domain-containing protein [Microbacterium sp. LRZ72]|uniref:transglycosylase domain-containing protein n=1 Tax=Microbacterium sp. LRZ72 TaxID=2942481 RepID=UPI0029A730A0|nr:transglycosylase domain-containing protein [Microbacterium sp. LRZ72]MDX2376899.1 transglycosylase domain-containing protein [Microbacterium sp. LRZ72]
MPGTKKTATGVLAGLAGLVGLSAVAGVLVTATVTPAIAVSGAAASSAITMFDNMPSYLEIEDLMLPTEIYATNDDGDDVQLARFYDQNRLPVEYDEIAPIVYDAILSSEDPRYYNHGGVDLIGTTRAAISNVTGSGQTQGGSSISQQYVKNVLVQRCESEAEDDETLRACWEDATTASGMEGIERKLQEVRYAIALEQRYSKNDILLGYLNIANFGGTTYGIEAAARYYFNTSASELNINQSATLAGMVQNPNTYRIDRPDSEVNGEENGYAQTLQRRNYVVERLYDDGKITEEQYNTVLDAPITPDIQPSSQGCVAADGAAFFCDYVRTIIENDEAFGATPEEREAILSRGGLKVYTTLDLDLQAAADEAIAIVPDTHPDLDLGATGVQIEPDTGRVLSMVQNRKYSQDADLTSSDPSYTSINYNTRKVNGGSNGFPVGSTYKLFTLLNWLEHGHSVNEIIDGRQRNFTIQLGCGFGTQRITPGQINNFQGVGGYNGTPMRFTADSLNTGFLAMSEQVSVCDTNKIADRMGVTLANGWSTYESRPDDGYQANVAYDILGSKNIAPIDMAGAYATIANEGVYCEPQAIDRVLGPDGEELPIPESSCDRVLDEAVAATAAYTLEGVLNGGSAVTSRIYDGVPAFGKTGIHEQEQTWMDGSSTEVTTVVWVGNVTGHGRLDYNYANGLSLWQMRHSIWPAMQGAANAKFGGEAFPSPDDTLTRQVYRDLPSVIGQSIEEARSTLTAAGFSVNVGGPVDGTRAEGTIERQDPGAGQVRGAVTVTIYPSNGDGATVPDVVGMSPDAAIGEIRGAGFGDPSVSCEENEDASEDGTVVAMSPSGGTSTNRNESVSITVERTDCS